MNNKLRCIFLESGKNDIRFGKGQSMIHRHLPQVDVAYATALVNKIATDEIRFSVPNSQLYN